MKYKINSSLHGLFIAIAILLCSGHITLAAPPTSAIMVQDINAHPVSALTHTAGAAQVFLFVAQDCPLCDQYVPEINRICTDYTPRGIAFSLVYVDPGLTPASARAHYTRRGFHCAGLIDSKHLLVQRLGATATPEVVVLGQRGQVLYRGRIDNRVLDWGVTHSANVGDLRAALDAILENRPVTQPWHKAIGCSIPALTVASSHG